MKKIICELCESTEFAKEGGMFVCQGCGTKYTPEEAKAMLQEVEDGSVPASATSSPSAPSNQQQVENLLVLARNAFDASNNTETEEYCKKIIELDVSCYEAWLLKGKAIGWQSTYGEPRVVEGAIAMRKAVDFAPEDKKADVSISAIIAIKNICNALDNLAKSNFEGNPTDANRLKFGEFLKACMNAIAYFNNVSQGIKAFGEESVTEHKKYAATQMNLAGVAALNMVREKWGNLELSDRSKSNWDTYLDWCDEVRLIFEDSIKWGKAVGEDDDKIITRYKNRIIVVEEPVDSHSYKMEWNEWRREYVWVEDYSLTNSAKEARKRIVKESESAIKEIEAKIAAEKEKAAEEARKAAEEAEKERIKAYWEEHKEEKEELESEKEQLNNKIAEINSQLARLESDIDNIEAESRTILPLEEELGKLYNQIKELNQRKSSLGLFANKEKKQISEEIAAIESKAAELENKVKEEKNARDEKISAEVAPLKAKAEELQGEKVAAERRISSINTKLSMPTQKKWAK